MPPCSRKRPPPRTDSLYLARPLNECFQRDLLDDEIELAHQRLPKIFCMKLPQRHRGLDHFFERWSRGNSLMLSMRLCSDASPRGCFSDKRDQAMREASFHEIALIVLNETMPDSALIYNRLVSHVSMTLLSNPITGQSTSSHS